jgi:hypothetical protein
MNQKATQRKFKIMLIVLVLSSMMAIPCCILLVSWKDGDNCLRIFAGEDKIIATPPENYQIYKISSIHFSFESLLTIDYLYVSDRNYSMRYSDGFLGDGIISWNLRPFRSTGITCD